MAMSAMEGWLLDSLRCSVVADSNLPPPTSGGLFLDPIVPRAILSSVHLRRSSGFEAGVCCSRGKGNGGDFLSVSLSIKEGEGFVGGSMGLLRQRGERNESSEKSTEEKIQIIGKVVERKKKGVNRGAGARANAMNTTKHLWAGAVSAMVSRTFVAPLERLKLEYIVRGEKRNLIALIKSIAAQQGLRGFWKGNFVNILRTAPFKAVNFYAYDTYRKQLLRISGNKEASNLERFLAGAAAGITATVLCIPMDMIRTRMVAPGGESLGGVVGVFWHLVQTEGFFSLYKGLLPSIISMAPSGAIFYGVYDMLKSSYLRSPKGMKRRLLREMKLQQQQQEGEEELSALDQLELGPLRTLIYGAIAGCCAEAATYPFEVIRRRLQMQVQATRLSAFATSAQIIKQGGFAGLYAGLAPSLLQVLPSAAISYFVYEFMKLVLKVD
ncbi:putative mitochondrial adenine nucleotide transporter BTL3 [Wolffia australiana]